ncbi:MAG: decaprenyl-phosphate phosphoribosyltransferase [Bacteroidetes bacterium]|nr:decaprenyl-phosphate phosphoribosyltransferase [Bacteroidota bacterium]
MFRDFTKLIRVSHWVKNTFVFVPLIFSKSLDDGNKILLSGLAFVSFSLASSIVYIFNDIIDRDADKNHPVKKNRPIASGKFSLSFAYFLIALLLVLVSSSLMLANKLFTIIVLLYIVINILYSIKLKHIVILDIMIIAAGFILRVIGGAFIIEVYISNWLILTTLFLSLFLAVMKRRSELNISFENIDTRKVLEDYSYSFIDQIGTISAGAVIICYAIYTVAERTVSYFNSESLIYTTIFVIFGIFRYMYIVYHKNKGEDPTKEIVKDIPIIVNVVLYTVSIVILMYFS